MNKSCLFALLLVITAGCASGPPELPYPAFIQTGELPSVFIAGLPGVEAKRLAGDPRTQRSSYQIVMPLDWSFSTSAFPGKSVEIFVLRGSIELSEFTLGRGGYAFLPSGTFGTTIRTDAGAEVLYFLDDLDPKAVIQTPLILRSQDIPWEPISADEEDDGLMVRELRKDPGSGARTWLLSVSPTALRRWSRSTVAREGFLVSGSDRISECVVGEPATGDYFPGGYFFRPPGAISGGPESLSMDGATWFLRETSHGETEIVPACAME